MSKLDQSLSTFGGQVGAVEKAITEDGIKTIYGWPVYSLKNRVHRLTCTKREWHINKKIIGQQNCSCQSIRSG